MHIFEETAESARLRAQLPSGVSGHPRLPGRSMYHLAAILGACRVPRHQPHRLREHHRPSQSQVSAARRERQLNLAGPRHPPWLASNCRGQSTTWQRPSSRAVRTPRLLACGRALARFPKEQCYGPDAGVPARGALGRWPTNSGAPQGCSGRQ